MKLYDAIVVGAGHNGLVAAARIAGSGKSVLVLEQTDRPGGTVGTDEFAPGFRSSTCFQTAELLHPSVVRSLRLEQHGLEYLPARAGTLLPIDPERALYVRGAGNEIEGVPEADRAALIELERFVGEIGRVLEPVFAGALPDVERRSAGDVVDLLRLGWRLRQLGDPDALEAMRFLPMSIKDVLDERLSDENLKAAVAAPALRGSWLAPRSPGSAFGLLTNRPHWVSGLFPAPAFVAGGMGGLADALAAAALAAGAEMRTGTRVSRIVKMEGGITGIVTEDGSEIRSRVVLSNVDPRRTFEGLADGTALEPEFAFALRGIRSRGSVALVRYALEGLPRFGGAAVEQLAGRIQLGPTLDHLERAFDPIKYGEIPETPWAEVYIPTLTDATLAASGKHVLAAWVQFIPYLPDGGESVAAEIGERTTYLIERFAPGFRGIVTHQDVVGPAELERRFGLTEGCVFHVEPALDQMLYLRPTPGWYGYDTPLAGLYLCGSGTHPGMGPTGLSGLNCAARVLADLKTPRRKATGTIGS